MNWYIRSGRLIHPEPGSYSCDSDALGIAVAQSLRDGQNRIVHEGEWEKCRRILNVLYDGPGKIRIWEHLLNESHLSVQVEGLFSKPSKR